MCDETKNFDESWSEHLGKNLTTHRCLLNNPKNSFERLGISNIYSVIFHSLKTFSIETIEAGFDYLVKCREKGQIEKIGLSLKSP